MMDWINQFFNEAITLIQNIDPFFSYLILSVASFIENIFPPAPGDIITVFGASLVGTGHLSFFWLLFSTTLGSVSGFMTYFFLAYKLGKSFFLRQKFQVISEGAMEKTELWFSRYGYKVVLANRFLSGLRSVISIFCGLSQLKFSKVLFYASISACLWNSLLIYIGMFFGKNWKDVQFYLTQYGKIVFSLIIFSVLFFFLWKGWRKKKTQK